MKILIGGDTVPTKSNYRLFVDGDVETLILVFQNFVECETHQELVTDILLGLVRR